MQAYRGQVINSRLPNKTKWKKKIPEEKIEIHTLGCNDHSEGLWKLMYSHDVLFTLLGIVCSSVFRFPSISDLQGPGS